MKLTDLKKRLDRATYYLTNMNFDARENQAAPCYSAPSPVVIAIESTECSRVGWGEMVRKNGLSKFDSKSLKYFKLLDYLNNVQCANDLSRRC